MTSYEKPDFWTQKAKKEGYPARSVYKLEEIDRKFRLVRSGMRVLDVGAAPGSWSLWVLKKLEGTGFLGAVDLEPLRIDTRAANFRFIQGDLYDAAVRTELASCGPYHLILSDAAPSTSGNRFVDQSESARIVESVIDFACGMLRPGGSLVVKIFQGGAEREFVQDLRSRFAAAKTFKPEVCRSESFETYLVANGFRS